MSLSSKTSGTHKHRWRATAHMDGCHFYTWVYVCACGASANTTSERDPTADSYSLVWMDDEGRDEPCQRCDELRAGAPVRHTVTVIAKDGTVEKDEATETPQGAEDAA